MAAPVLSNPAAMPIGLLNSISLKVTAVRFLFLMIHDSFVFFRNLIVHSAKPWAASGGKINNSGRINLYSIKPHKFAPKRATSRCPFLETYKAQLLSLRQNRLDVSPE